MWLITCRKPIKVCQIYLSQPQLTDHLNGKRIVSRIDKVIASQPQLSELGLKLLQESSTILDIRMSEKIEFRGALDWKTKKLIVSLKFNILIFISLPFWMTNPGFFNYVL